MEAFDEEAEKQIEAEYGSDSDSYTMLDQTPISNDMMMTEADIHDEKVVAPTNDRALITDAKTCKSPKSCGKECKSKLNNKNSSDDECACTPTPMNATEKKKVIQIQAKR
jgi:hypothetical protein